MKAVPYTGRERLGKGQGMNRAGYIIGTMLAAAILGALLGAAVNNAELSAFLLGIGVGAIIQVIQQLVPTIRDRAGRALYPASIGGILAGVAVLYVTGLLVSV